MPGKKYMGNTACDCLGWQEFIKRNIIRDT